MFHPTPAKYTFFSSPHGTFIKIDHILGNKINLIFCKKNRNHEKHVSDHNEIKLEINNREIAGKFPNIDTRKFLKKTSQ